VIVETLPLEKYNMQIKLLVRESKKLEYPLPVLQIFIRMMDNEKEIKHLYATMNEKHIKDFYFALGFETMKWALTRFPESEAKSAMQELIYEIGNGANEYYSRWQKNKEKGGDGDGHD